MITAFALNLTRRVNHLTSEKDSWPSWEVQETFSTGAEKIISKVFIEKSAPECSQQEKREGASQHLVCYLWYWLFSVCLLWSESISFHRSSHENYEMDDGMLKDRFKHENCFWNAVRVSSDEQKCTAKQAKIWRFSEYGYKVVRYWSRSTMPTTRVNRRQFPTGHAPIHSQSVPNTNNISAIVSETLSFANNALPPGVPKGYWNFISRLFITFSTSICRTTLYSNLNLQMHRGFSLAKRRHSIKSRSIRDRYRIT